MIDPNQQTLTAAQTARMLKSMGFNWLDIEFVLEFSPHTHQTGHMHYTLDGLERFVGRAFWLNETPLSTPLPVAA